MRTFPKNYKHLNIDLQGSNSEIGKFEDGFSKIWKIRRGIFQIFGNSKIRKFSVTFARLLGTWIADDGCKTSVLLHYHPIYSIFKYQAQNDEISTMQLQFYLPSVAQQNV